MDERDLEIDLIDKNGLLLFSNYNKAGILKDNLFSIYRELENNIANKEIGSFESSCFGEYENEYDIISFIHERGYLDFAGNDWALLIHIPTRIAFAPAVRLRNITVSILSVIIIVSI